MELRAQLKSVYQASRRCRRYRITCWRQTVAEDIVKSYSSPTLAVLALDRNLSSPNFNSGGYLWTSKEDLPFPPKPGDLLDVQITTRRVVPAQLVIPSLKRFFGLTPPEAQSNSSV